VIDETSDIKSFYLSPIDNRPLAPYRAGQFLTVQLPTTQETIVRVWSLSDYQNQPSQYRLSIKKESKGLGSGYMHEQISKGASLLIKPPLGRFVLDRSGFKPVLMIAGGIGITPLLSMLKAQVERGEKMPPLYAKTGRRNHFGKNWTGFLSNMLYPCYMSTINQNLQMC
jgi:ferredoxin-NADP reductase